MPQALTLWLPRLLKRKTITFIVSICDEYSEREANDEEKGDTNAWEFYYIQMEKYARQAVSEGVLHAEDLHVSGECEIYRVLNLHYNRNNHIEVCGPQVPTNFRFVIEQTLREFFKAIQDGKDQEPSWKKSIYKIISRMDDPVPEYFKSPNFLEQLE
ncbi:hypothetical protein M8J76_011720 [Diaphorina citri]|nr:hypothetical protein M8J76_011720 [Diaphorina citri]